MIYGDGREPHDGGRRRSGIGRCRVTQRPADVLGAHGFLLHNLLSPITNQRTDHYGGSIAKRTRYPLEVATTVREVCPRHKALGLRIAGTDWVDGRVTPEEAGIFAGKLRDLGFDCVCVSSAASVRRRGLTATGARHFPDCPRLRGRSHRDGKRLIIVCCNAPPRRLTARLQA